MENIEEASQRIRKYFEDMDNGLINIVKVPEFISDKIWQRINEISKTKMESFVYHQQKFVEIIGISSADVVELINTFTKIQQNSSMVC